MVPLSVGAPVSVSYPCLYGVVLVLVGSVPYLVRFRSYLNSMKDKLYTGLLHCKKLVIKGHHLVQNKVSTWDAWDGLQVIDLPPHRPVGRYHLAFNANP